MSRIRLLDDHLISQIAAGEVVERPASVVKELVENALDAGATEVSVELESGGKRRIVVTDDGCGLGQDDALLAFDRHATSKISTFQDLEEVGTLGFRGEALASIAAVSRVELRSAESAGDGRRVRIEGGRVLGVEPVAHPQGTRIEIASLFYNVPARRKFLKKPATELRRTVEVVQGYALAHPEVRFRIAHEGRQLLDAPPAPEGIEASDALRERIAQVFGRELAGRLQAIGDEFIGEDEAIVGFVGDRETTRSRRTFLYVNRRLIRDRQLLARFYRAVRDVWHSEDFPALFLFLEVRPQDVDVNVHPQKSEVRFRDPKLVDRVEAAIHDALESGRRSAPARLAEPPLQPQVPAAWEGLGGRSPRGGWEGGAWRGGAPSVVREPERAWDQPAASSAEAGGEGPGHASPGALPQDGVPQYIARPRFDFVRPTTSPLAGRGKMAQPFRVLGQYKGSLILLEGHDGLYLVDQHAAHERLLYERLRLSIASREPRSQRLLTPVLLELARTEAMRLRELTEALERHGFGIATLSGDTLALTSIPDVLRLEQAEAVVLGLASDGDRETPAEADALGARILQGLAADLSCKAAIKIHRPMKIEEMEALVSELFDAEQPYACPHGRPTVLHLSDGEMERRFGRRG